MVVLFELGDSLMLLRDCLDLLLGHFILLLEEANLSIMHLYLMSLFHLFCLLGMILNQITVLLLKILNVVPSMIDIILKGSNFMFVLTIEHFPFLLLFLGEKVMIINLSLELNLFLSKLLGKSFVILYKILL
jgi:hypothetical protein